jgi:hypothetical protein
MLQSAKNFVHLLITHFLTLGPALKKDTGHFQLCMFLLSVTITVSCSVQETLWRSMFWVVYSLLYHWPSSHVPRNITIYWERWHVSHRICMSHWVSKEKGVRKAEERFVITQVKKKKLWLDWEDSYEVWNILGNVSKATVVLRSCAQFFCRMYLLGLAFKRALPLFQSVHIIQAQRKRPSCLTNSSLQNKSWCSIMGWTIEVRSPTGADFSSSPCVQTGSGAHPASYPVGTNGFFPRGKARLGCDTDHSPPSSAEVKNE